jgi:heat shock protein HtpX
VIAVVFVGIFSFVGEMAFRGLWHSGGGTRTRSSSSSGDSRNAGGAFIAILVALAMIAIAYALAIVIRFALSRRREYLADAGAVELTKNPDAMISALQKISGNAAVNAPSEVREMFIENPHSDFASLFATHPPIAKRIDALVKFGGGRVSAPQAAPIAPTPSAPTSRKRGPWG